MLCFILLIQFVTWCVQLARAVHPELVVEASTALVLCMPRHSLGPCDVSSVTLNATVRREEPAVSWLVSFSRFPLALSHEVGSGREPSALKTHRGPWENGVLARDWPLGPSRPRSGGLGAVV